MIAEQVSHRIALSHGPVRLVLRSALFSVLASTPAYLVCQVGLRPRRQQQLHHLHVPLPRREVQRRTAALRAEQCGAAGQAASGEGPCGVPRGALPCSSVRDISLCQPPKRPKTRRWVTHTRHAPTPSRTGPHRGHRVAVRPCRQQQLRDSRVPPPCRQPQRCPAVLQRTMSARQVTRVVKGRKVRWSCGPSFRHKHLKLGASVLGVARRSGGQGEGRFVHLSLARRLGRACSKTHSAFAISLAKYPAGRTRTIGSLTHLVACRECCRRRR